jgi:hypothetical protein
MRTKEFVPNMVVFVGSDSATKAMTHFQQIINDDNDDDDDEQPHRPKCMAESTPILDGGLDIAIKYFKADLARRSQKLLEKLQMSAVGDDITGGRPPTTRTTTTTTTMRRVVVQIQFALVSADYHLCILNDLHVRSPMQSFLKCFDHWDLVDHHHHNRHTSSFAPKRIVVEPSWRYLYASTTGLRYYYPSISSDDDEEEEKNIAISFCATCYRRVHLLIPVLMNIRAVAQNREFFQRDNYSLLVQVRRAFITDVENMHHNNDEHGGGGGDDPTKTLRSVRKYMTALHYMNGTNKSLDVVLDGALLSMGRCSDLVRPAGLFTGSVPTADFRRAVTFLEHAITQITMACDPDRPFVSSVQHPAATTAVATTTTSSMSSTVVSLCRWVDKEQQNELAHYKQGDDDSSRTAPGRTRPPKKQSLLSRRQKRSKRKLEPCTSD